MKSQSAAAARRMPRATSEGQQLLDAIRHPPVGCTFARFPRSERIEDPIHAAIIDGGGILVQVPSPARFGLHKLILSQARGASSHAKVEKDLLQAGQVLSVVAEERTGDLELAWSALEDRAASWVLHYPFGSTVAAVM